MALLELPADVVRYVLEHVYGETDPLAYEPLSWAETRTHQAAAGIVWAVRFLPTPFTEFAAMVGRQSNADLYQSAGLWVYRWRARRSVVATFTPARNLTTPPTFGRRPVRTALAARLSVSWDLEHATGDFRQSEVYVSALVNRLEPAQWGRRVTTDQPIELPLPYVVAPAAARYLGRTALTRVDQQRWTVELETDWDALPIEKGDTILVDSPLLVASLGTSRGTFLVTGKRYDPATDSILLQAEEAPTALLTRTLTFAVRAPFGTTRLLTFAMRPVLARTLTFALSTGFGPGVLTRPLTFVLDVETEPGTVTCFLTFAIGPALPPGTITRTLTFAIASNLVTRTLEWAIGPPPGIFTLLPGTYAGTGAPARLRVPLRSGAYALTGQAAALSVAGSAPTPPTFVNGTSVGSPNVTTPVVLSFTPGVGATYLLVRVGTDNFQVPTTVQAVPTSGPTLTLALIGKQLASGDGRHAALYGAACVASMAYTLTLTFPAIGRAAVMALAYAGVGSVGTAVGASPGGVTTSVIVPLGSSTALVVDCAVSHGTQNLTSGAGQTTELPRVLDGADQVSMGGSHKAGTGDVTMTETWQSGILTMVAAPLYP